MTFNVGICQKPTNNAEVCGKHASDADRFTMTPRKVLALFNRMSQRVPIVEDFAQSRFFQVS